MFIGRKKELDELERVYMQDGFHIFIVAGREGAGKTTLIERFCRDKNTIFFTASRESGRANLQRFSREILAHYKDEQHEPFPFWNSAFEYISNKQGGGSSSSESSDYAENYELQDFMQAQLGDTEEQENKQERVIVVIDEFGELCERDPVFLGMFTDLVDKQFKDSKIFMIITSSDTKFLQKTFLTKTAPLSHRVTGHILLSQFTLTDNIVEQIKEKVVKRSMGMDAAKVVKFSADDVIISEGELNTEMYKIISGKAICYLGYGTDDEYVLGTLKDGQSFGEYALIRGKPNFYTVVAFTDVLLLKVDRETFPRFIEMNANNAVEIMRNMARMISMLKANIDMLRLEQKE